MTFPAGSWDASYDSAPEPAFSFSPTYSSLADILVGDGGAVRSTSRDYYFGGVPKFKSAPPPSLPISQPPVSPSSRFAIPAGLSPSELLGSPLLLSSSHILPSPTTGTFPAQALNSRFSIANSQPGNRLESRSSSDFSFHINTNPQSYQIPPYQNSLAAISTDCNSELSSMKPSIKVEDVASTQANSHTSNGSSGIQPSLPLQNQRRLDDGYNWRKYGQKQVKGSENPRSYYKCSYANCPTKKMVERSLDGQITEIVYKGTHNHPKPQSARRNSAAAGQAFQGIAVPSEASENSFGARSGTPSDSVQTPDDSSVSFVHDDEIDMSSQKSNHQGSDEFDEDELDSKRWKGGGGGGGDNEGLPAPGNRSVREPRVVVQTQSDIDILDDGYRWRKYGQKVVKGNPNPRSYYKCTTTGCPVRKHVERAPHDSRSVITAYEGKHNHDVPAARGSSAPLFARPQPDNNGVAMAMAIRPSAMANQIDQIAASNSINSFNLGNNFFTEAKEEPRGDWYIDSFLS
ncbi:putative WRKY transcription factor 26 [Curcuma longa]|uniref:putative WRKY transcription factor 26 n=1 Tax=Curcuma longa TaxID=136217 RepID=UPI003D9F53DE